MKLKQAVVALALILTLGLLAYQSRLAWAKDDDVLTVEGPLTVNVDAQTVKIGDTVLQVDDGTYIYINDNDAYDDDPTLQDLAAFVRRNPGVGATGEYTQLNGALVAAEIDVDTTTEVVGPISVDVDRKRITVDGVVLPYSEDETYIYIDDDEYDELQDLADFIDANPGVSASALYVTDGGEITTTEIDIDSEVDITGSISAVDVANNTVTVNGIVMTVNDETTFSIDYDDDTIQQIADFIALHPGYQADVSYYVDGTAILEDLEISTETATMGPVVVDTTANTVTVNGLTIQVDWDSTIYIADNDQYVLTDLAEFIARNPDMPVYVSYYGSPPLAIDIRVDNSREVTGKLTVDAVQGTVTVQGITLSAGADTWIDINDIDSTLQDLAGYVSRNPDVEADVTYHIDAGLQIDSIYIDTTDYVSGVVSYDSSRKLLTVDDVTARVDPKAEIWVNGQAATLTDVAGFLGRNPGAAGSATTAQDAGTYFVGLNIELEQWLTDVPTVDFSTSTIEIDGITAYPTPETRLEIDWTTVPFSLPAVADYLSAHPSARADVRLYKDGVSYVDLIELWSPASADARHAHAGRAPFVPRGSRRKLRPAPRAATPHPTRPAKSRTALQRRHHHGRRMAAAPKRKTRKPFDDLGRLTGVDVKRGVLRFQSKGLGLVEVKVHSRTRIELNAARVTLDELSRVVPPGSSLWMETLYSRKSHVARRIWVEQSLTEGSAQVLATTATVVKAPRAAAAPATFGPKPDGITLTLATRTRANKPAGTQARLFPRSLVWKGNHLVRPDRIRPGDVIRYDGFNAGQRSYIPRLLIPTKPPKRS